MTKEKEKVGYKKPPKKSQFKKGKSGNPNGRPKKVTEDPWGVFQEEFSREIRVKENGVVSEISAWRATMRQLAQLCAKGQLSAIRQAVTMKEKHKPVELEHQLTQINIICDSPEGVDDEDN